MLMDWYQSISVKTSAKHCTNTWSRLKHSAGLSCDCLQCADTNILLLLFLRLPEMASPEETEPSSKVKVCLFLNMCQVSWFVLSVTSSQIAVLSRDSFSDVIVALSARSGNFQTNRWRLERITPDSTVRTLWEKWVEKKWIFFDFILSKIFSEEWFAYPF